MPESNVRVERAHEEQPTVEIEAEDQYGSAARQVSVGAWNGASDSHKRPGGSKQEGEQFDSAARQACRPVSLWCR